MGNISQECKSENLGVTMAEKTSVMVTQTHPIMRARMYMGLLLRLVMPALLAAYHAVLRNQRQLLPTVFALCANAISFTALSGPGRKEAASEVEESVTCVVLAEPSGAVRADVVFVHGLHGSVAKTWRQGDWDPAGVATVPLRAHAPLQAGGEQDKEWSECWPRDWLPKDCPGVRVLAVSYTTDPFLWRPIWVAKRNRTSMQDRSAEMMEYLQKLGVGKYPITWVGHSKGGLFIKQMLVNAAESDDNFCVNLYQNTRSVMFYSVPHRGSTCANINFPLLRQSIELTEVQKDCENVLELHSKFMSLIQKNIVDAEIFSFTETVQTLMSIVYLQIVSTESADAGIGVFHGAPVDHRNICKPASRQCFLYRELVDLINRTV